MDETKKAITLAEQAGNELYRYVSSKPLSKFDQAVANQRYTMVDPWNKELIWGYSGKKETGSDQNFLQVLVIPKGFCPRGQAPIGGIGPTLEAVEFFYSENGIPCDEDPAYKWEDRMKIIGNTSGLHRIFGSWKNTDFHICRSQRLLFLTVMTVSLWLRMQKCSIECHTATTLPSRIGFWKRET